MPTAAEYREQLKALLPPGQAFPRDPGTTLHDLLDGMSIELARVDARAGVLEETLQGRRNALLTKLTSTGGQSAAYFIQLAASLGYTVTIEQFRPFRVGMSRAGDALTNGPWAFTWLVRAPEVTVTSFRVGQSAVGERLRTWGNDTLECKINQLKPAHTIALFAYGD
jgi:uncharacterized protein YmfQ (DUF2313 family)